MNPLFWPFINTLVRYILRPFAAWIHPDLHPRVTGVIRVKMTRPKTLRLKVNPTSYLGKVLFFRGIEGYEWHTMKIFIELAKQSRNFLDIGANIGYYSCIAALHNPSLRIFSFEPLPSAYKFLCDNIALNGFSNVKAVQTALSNRVDVKPFFVSHDPTFAHLEDHLTTTGGFNELLSSRTKLTYELEVETTTMDRFWELSAFQNEAVDLIKLDTEASEHLILAGGANILAQHQPIIFCEVLPKLIGGEIEAILKKHNYTMFSVCEKGLTQTETLSENHTSTTDYVFVHPSRHHQVRSYLA